MQLFNFDVACARLQASQKLHSCWIVFLAFLFLHYYVDVVAFPYDSSHYWRLSDPDTLLSYPKTIRGYFYPLILSPVRMLGRLVADSDLIIFRLASSLVYAFLLTVTVPNLFVNIFGGKVSLVRRIAFSTLVATIFPGLLLFPLSDLPAFLLLFAAVSLAVRAGRLGTLWPLFWAGILTSASYNVRTIYLFSFLLLVVIIPFFLLGNKPWATRFMGLMVFILGALIVATPQLFINMRTHGKVTPLVQASDVSSNSLLAAQLRWGIMIQRYETSVRPDSPAPSIFYLDPAGANLFAAQQVEATPTTVSSYLKLVLKNPTEFMGIYGRHLVNGLDVRDGMVYVKKESGKRSVFSIFNFCILFCGLFILSIHRPAIFRFRTLLTTAVLLIPVAAILPGAVETRFFLPLHLMIYGVIAFHFDLRKVRSAIIATPLLVTISLVASLLMFTAITTSTMVHSTYSWPLQYR